MILFLAKILAAFIAVLGIATIVGKFWLQRQIRKGLALQLESWTAMARERGFEVATRDDEVVMRGTVASRSFEIDSGHFYGYGADYETALHFPVEDEAASFAIRSWDAGLAYGLKQGPTGDEVFDARYQMRANDAGVPWLARFGPTERRLIAEHDLLVDQAKGEVRILVDYRMPASQLDAVCRLVANVWGEPRPEGRDEGELARSTEDELVRFESSDSGKDAPASGRKPSDEKRS